MRDWEREEKDMNWKDLAIGVFIGWVTMFFGMAMVGFYLHLG